jgi:hypothetical protein
MFDSLVFLLHFNQTGGEFMLRHRGRESTVDGCTLLGNDVENKYVIKVDWVLKVLSVICC